MKSKWDWHHESTLRPFFRNGDINFGAGRPPFWRNFGKEAFGSSLYTLPSNGINRYYEENFK